MYRLIDLDQAGKEPEGYVFLVTLGGERVGFSDSEIVEMLRARPASKGAKKGAKKGASAGDPESLGEPELPVESPSQAFS